MKNILSKLFIFAMIISMASCSDEAFTSKYADPGKTSTASCEKLMTGVFYSGREYTFNSYWRIFTWDYSAISRYAQTLGVLNGDGRYQYSDSYASDRWNNFYNVLSQFRVLENEYNKLSDADKANYEVFVLLAKVYMYDHLIQITNCWGDVPYSKAGYLSITGDVATSNPAYDTAESIYSAVMSDLKAINTKLAGMTSLSPLTTSYLKAQDFINGGNLLSWRKYANSLRLRVATTVADNGTLTADARAAIREMLTDPSTYPMVDSNSENIKVIPDTDGFNYGQQYQDGWETWIGELNRASKAMVDALQGDARMDILFDKNKGGNYVGVDTHTDFATQSTLFESGTHYSAYDSATFSRNKKLEGIIISAAEVALHKSNAFSKGYATGDAKTAFVKGMVLSTEMYYGINAQATYRTPTAAPATNAVQAFATAKWDAASNKDAEIATQTWLNFGFLNSTQAWTTVRRTGYPVLYFPTDNSSATCPNVPVRLRYPPSERNSNTANYTPFKNEDNYTTKMFWAK
ncbi:MAG TPA: SusD/RagB family nutrient-binding outer membrane lipoprotein [Paludibacteraceae bacterium]|nr:SusD/RagB family nutrient-binding outer membrane lipoprotein [Paludibacteraceae bacterium]HPT43753.1 SusD/RagB family nutrient-binding outer membrane lipoprotein [Paludibacteraceae bacterium]